MGGANTTQALSDSPGVALEAPNHAGSAAVFTHAHSEAALHARYVDSCENVMWKLAQPKYLIK